MNEGTPWTKIFNISYWALLRVKLRIYSVRFTEQTRGKEGALRSHSWTLSILQRVHSLKTKSLSMNRSSVNTCSYIAQRSTGSKLMSIFSASTRYVGAVSYTHLDVYKRQTADCVYIGNVRVIHPFLERNNSCRFCCQSCCRVVLPENFRWNMLPVRRNGVDKHSLSVAFVFSCQQTFVFAN